MGDDYSGPVTVDGGGGRWQIAASGRALAFADALGWRTSTCGRKQAPNKTQEQLFIHDMVSWQLAQI